MSHTTTIKTAFYDESAVQAALKEIGLPAAIHGKAQLFQFNDPTEHEGLLVQLPGWKYPVIINTKTGEAKMDNYNGAWGAQVELEKFTQYYGVHKATMEAHRRGLRVVRNVQPTGVIRLQITGRQL